MAANPYIAFGISYSQAGRAGIEPPSSRGRDSHTNSRHLLEFVGAAPSRRM